jgi:hypothetical protein
LNRLPEPHGHGSLRPSFSTSSLFPWTICSPRFTCASLGKPLRRLLIGWKPEPVLVHLVVPHGTRSFRTRRRRSSHVMSSNRARARDRGSHDGPTSRAGPACVNYSKRPPIDRTSREDPRHPIIERPWQYRIVSFSYVEGSEPYVDLALRKGDTTRRLRFLSPQGIEIENGFPSTTGGMCILDVQARGLEGIGVRLADFEASWGKVTLWARAVVDLDAEVGA